MATWEFPGGIRSYHGSNDALFDDQYGNRNMYHSSTCDEERGIVIKFNQPIKYTDMEVFTRSNCCRDERYRAVCLYADGEEIACTPD